MPKNGACNLSSINVSEYVVEPFTDNARIDYASLIRDMIIYVRAMDKIVDENSALHALPEQREFAKNYRNIGIGIMGLHDMMIKLGIKYGSYDSIVCVRQLMSELFKSAVCASSELAAELGSFPKYNEKIWKSKIIKYHFGDDTIKILKKHGLRNSSLLSIAPTGSIGTLLGVSTGVEPHFALKYKRRTVSLHGNKEQYYDVEVPIVKQAREANMKNLDDILVTSQEIPWKYRIDVQASLQASVDTAISSTVNLPSDISQGEVEKLYLYAWEAGLKGCTIYRDGSRQGVLTKDTPQTVSCCNKRPDVLKCKLIRFKNDNENWIAFIGLCDNAPYEIFTGRNDLDEFPIPNSITEGEIIKIKDEHGKRYDFQYTDKYGYTNRLGGLSRIFNQEYWNYAKLISALLRGGIETDKIVKIIDGMHFESETLNSWKNGVKRAFKSFIADGTESHEKCPECGEHLTYQSGCTQCLNCGYSRCG